MTMSLFLMIYQTQIVGKTAQHKIFGVGMVLIGGKQ